MKSKTKGKLKKKRGPTERFKGRGRTAKGKKLVTGPFRIASGVRGRSVQNLEVE